MLQVEKAEINDPAIRIKHPCFGQTSRMPGNKTLNLPMPKTRGRPKTMARIEAPENAVIDTMHALKMNSSATGP